MMGEKEMQNDDYVKPPKKFTFKNIAGKLKEAYSSLHPNYWKRKLIHLVIVVPVVFIIYGIIYGVILMKLTGTTDATMPWVFKAIDMILIVITTMISAYFYPFALWWYKQSFTGTTLNNMVYIGTVWGVVLRKMGNIFFGIILAGVLAPITGPLALRKCRKKNIIIGEACDFE